VNEIMKIINVRFTIMYLLAVDTDDKGIKKKRSLS